MSNERSPRAVCSTTIGTSGIGPLLLVSVWAVLIANAAHGQHQFRLLGVPLDLLAQVGDVHVAGPLVAVELGLPELLHDLGPGEDLPWPGDEEAQQLELRAGQVDRHAADRGDVADEVDRDRA